ncbi:hypothetical protein SteCoe_17453 [Stentor coeruleus]|uniref:Peptidase C51 domain-containing protein n=1 Tax=Stentor coeruleus TaxID=5963 RepID=A0A1R2BZ79_9CILI|nr:hypothetical protein SteCoe_17453 [Stentor coeruleus]
MGQTINNIISEPSFGTVLGSYKNVEAYSNSRINHNSGKNYINKHYTGYKYQCVEYSRRFLIITKQITFANIKCAYNIWDLIVFQNLITGENFDILKFENGSFIPPKEDCLLIYNKGYKIPYGHVAVITKVNLSKGYVKIAEQNEREKIWKRNYARKLYIKCSQGKFIIQDKYPIIGWVVYEN